MSREGKQPGFCHGDDNGNTNAVFDGPLRGGDYGGTSDSFSHKEHQKTDWKKFADKATEDYIAGCPGSYRTSEHFRNTSLSSEERNPPMNVCFFVIVLLVKIIIIIVIIFIPKLNHVVYLGLKPHLWIQI